jgi:hypothetical protein
MNSATNLLHKVAFSGTVRTQNNQSTNTAPPLGVGGQITIDAFRSSFCVKTPTLIQMEIEK